MSDTKSQGAQCWICPRCHDDKHHQSGDEHCLKQQISNLRAANKDAIAWESAAKADLDEALRELEVLRRIVAVPVKDGRPQVTSSMKADCIGEFEFAITAECGECIDVGADDDCEVCRGGIAYERKVTVPWDTCKQIYKAMAESAMRTQASEAEAGEPL